MGFHLLTVPEVAEVLRVKPRTVYGYVSKKLLKAMMLPGGDMRIKDSDLELFLSVLEAGEAEVDADQGADNLPAPATLPGATGDLFTQQAAE
jgi:excisionase family DNA binding protein